MNGKADLYQKGPRMYHPTAMSRTGGNSTYKYINTFRPLKWHYKPWQDISPVILFSGSAGGGKSFLAANKVHAFCLKYPNATVQVLRKTKTSLTNSTLVLLERYVIGDDPRVIHNSSESRFLYDNGSILIYDGMSDPKARERIRSRNLDMAWLEEAIEFEEEDFNEVHARMRGTAAPWLQIILSTNPDGPLHWINQRLILQNEAVVYYSGAKDNPYNPPSYVESLDRLTGVQKERLVYGRWVSGSGIIFDTWVDDATGDDTNVTKSADVIPGGGEIIWVIDDGYTGKKLGDYYTGTSHPRCVLLVQRRQDGILAVADESYAIETLASNHIAALLDKWPRPYMVIRDRAAASLDGACREHGIRNIVYNTMNVDESIKETRTWIAPDANGVRKIIVHPRCGTLRYEMSQYSTDKNGKVIKEHDHGPDCIRYLCWNEAYGRGRKVDIVSWRHIADRMERAHA